MAETAKTITTFGRYRAAFYALVLLAALCASLWMMFEGGATRRYSREYVLLISTLGSVLFGAGFVASMVQYFRPSRLHLSPAGFQFEWIWSLPLIPWADVERFDIVRQGPIKHVCFQLTPSASAAVGPAWWRRGSSKGFDAALYTGMGGAPAHVLDELREWHRRYGG